MMSRGLVLAIGLLAGEGAAFAKPPADKDAAGAVEAMQALFQPIASLPAGPARTKRACADVKKLLTAAKAIPLQAPVTTPLDPASWRGDAELVPSSANDLVESCKAPDLKRKDGPGSFRTADYDVETLKQCLEGIVEDLKPRSLTPAMKSFDTVLRRAWADKKKHKQTCKNTPELGKLAPALEAAPPGVDKAKWDEAFAIIRRGVSDMRGFYCGPGSGDDGNIYDDTLDQVHESFAKMVLLLPVDAK